jgi:hypothetical protein
MAMVLSTAAMAQHTPGNSTGRGGGYPGWVQEAAARRPSASPRPTTPNPCNPQPPLHSPAVVTIARIQAFPSIARYSPPLTYPPTKEVSA